MRISPQKLSVAIGIVLCLASCVHVPHALQAERPINQKVFIALDGVPYQLVKEIYDEGHFLGFAPPSKLISTFPSVSSAAFGSMFHVVGADKPPGYDDKFYSYEKGKLLGSLIDPYEAGPNEYSGHFDLYRKTSLQWVCLYMAPGFAGYRDLKRIKRIIWRQPLRNYYIVYVGAPDGAGHILGRGRVKHWLIFMDDYLMRLKRDYKKEFNRDLNIVLFSDHGFYYGRLKTISNTRLVHDLRRAGFELKNSLKKDNHVVPAVLGNLNGAPFHVADRHAPKIAKILIEQKGMDIVTYTRSDKIIILAKRNGGEKAELVTKGRRKLCYQIIKGDPLLYKPIMDKLRSRGRLDSEGCARERDWFEATVNHRYPDALYRIHHAFNGMVINTAPILINMEPKYEYGSFWTRLGSNMRGGLKGTHGGLFQEVSAAFIMENDPEIFLPHTMRYDEVMPYFFPNGLTEKPEVKIKNRVSPRHYGP